MTLGQRIRYVRKSQPGSPSQEKFAETLGWTRGQLKQYELDVVAPAKDRLMLLCSKYYISYLWLTEEVGPMEEAPTVESLTQKYLGDESDLTKAIVQSLAGLPEESWEQLKTWVESIRKEGC